MVLRRTTATAAVVVVASATATVTTATTATATVVAVVVAVLGLPVASLHRGLLHRLHGLLGLGRQARNGAGNALGVLIDVQALVNASGDGLDLGTEIALNVVEVETILPVDQVDSQTKVAVAARTTNSVQVGLGILGEVKVDDNVDSLNIDTTGEQIRANKVAADTVAEVVEYTVTGLLLHPSVTIETRVAKLSDLLSQKLDTVGGVAEDDGLVDLKLREEGVETVHLLLLLDEGVVLGDTTQGQLVHEVDFIRAGHVAVREIFDGQREGGGKEHNLAVLGVELEKLLNGRCELNGKELVSLIHDEHGAFAQIGNVLASKIKNSARGTDHNMDGVLQTDDVVAEASATSGNHDVDAKVLAKGLANLRGLHGKLSRRDENEALNLGNFRVDALECRDNEGSSLSGSVLGSGEDIATSQSNRDRFLLNRRGLLEASLEDTHKQVALERKVFEFEALGFRNILNLDR